VERVLREAGEQLARRSRLRRKGTDLRWFSDKVAPGFGVKTEDLESGSRSLKVGNARALLCYMAVRGRRGLNGAVVQGMLERP
jgi:chromosomal replication initiation ATPase DnaA